MKCKYCQHAESKVLESRESKDLLTIRRRRECINCGFRFTTFERVEERPLYIVKNRGTREPFFREKLIKSLMIACRKRDMNADHFETIADYVESTLQKTPEDERTSKKIGELVLSSLLTLDPVAYVRFASVYRAFSNPEDFVEELSRLTEQSKRSKFVTSKPTDID
jgi:transcriptional repressor NrdR